MLALDWQTLASGWTRANKWSELTRDARRYTQQKRKRQEAQPQALPRRGKRGDSVALMPCLKVLPAGLLQSFQGSRAGGQAGGLTRCTSTRRHGPGKSSRFFCTACCFSFLARMSGRLQLPVANPNTLPFCLHFLIFFLSPSLPWGTAPQASEPQWPPWNRPIAQRIPSSVP